MYTFLTIRTLHGHEKKFNLQDYVEGLMNGARFPSKKTNSNVKCVNSMEKQSRRTELFATVLGYL